MFSIPASALVWNDGPWGAAADSSGHVRLIPSIQRSMCFHRDVVSVAFDLVFRHVGALRVRYRMGCTGYRLVCLSGWHNDLRLLHRVVYVTIRVAMHVVVIVCVQTTFTAIGSCALSVRVCAAPLQAEMRLLNKPSYSGRSHPDSAMVARMRRAPDNRA